MKQTRDIKAFGPGGPRTYRKSIRGPATIFWGGKAISTGTATITFQQEPSIKIESFKYPREITVPIRFKYAPGARRMIRKINPRRRKSHRRQTARARTIAEKMSKRTKRLLQSILPITPAQIRAAALGKRDHVHFLA